MVLALEERRRQALLARDGQALNDLLADALVYVHSSGSCDNKESYLKKLTSGSLTYLKLNFSDCQVQTMPHFAVVSGRMDAQISLNGELKNVATLFMTVWGCDSDGVWRLHAHQGTPRSAH